MVVGGLVPGFWVVGENCYGFVGSQWFRWFVGWFLFGISGRLQWFLVDL